MDRLGIVDIGMDTNTAQIVNIGTHGKERDLAALLYDKESIIGVGWTRVGNLKGKTKEQIKKALVRYYKESSPSKITGTLLRFRDDIHKGDIVLAYKSRNTVALVGEVTSDYFYNVKNEVGRIMGRIRHSHQRRVMWWNSPKNFSRFLLSEELRDWVKNRGTLHIFRHPYDIEKLTTELKDIGYKLSDQALTDEKEQEELERKIEDEISQNPDERRRIIDELKSLTPKSPEQIEYRGRTYKRDNKTIADLKNIRNFKCQICGEKILKKNGKFYVEAAHIRPKSAKGPETPDNILILCPNHHKEFDFGSKKILEHTTDRIVFDLNEKRHQINLSLDQVQV